MPRSVHFITLSLLSALVIVAWAVQAHDQPPQDQPELRVETKTAVPPQLLGPEAQAPQLVTGRLSQTASSTKPTSPKAARPRPWAKAGPLDLPVKAWLAVYVSPNGQEQTLTAHQAEQAYPIAGLTK